MGGQCGHRGHSFIRGSLVWASCIGGRSRLRKDRGGKDHLTPERRKAIGTGGGGGIGGGPPTLCPTAGCRGARHHRRL